MPDLSPDSVRVRFAPSPTGFLHLGGARTALFNWLYARHHGGTYILRVEDTDAARNTEEAAEAILDGLRWLGLDWDEGPFFQSRRTGLYESYLSRLVEADLAYTDGAGTTRFRVPDEEITVEDVVKGEVTTNLFAQGSHSWDAEAKKEVATNPDMAVRRADGTFLFHFVNVVDDIDMGITHVLRGEDHLLNTAKHIALFRAFGAPVPVFIHVPLILTAEGKKLSKRDAGSGISAYIEGGFLPAAVVNFVALLGWSPKDDREKMEISEIIERFSFAGLNKSNARFDLEKCTWLNGQYVAELSAAEFTRRALPFVQKVTVGEVDGDYAAKVLPLVQEKVRLLSEVPGWVDYFFTDEVVTDPEAAEKAFGKGDPVPLLSAVKEALGGLGRWTTDAIKECVGEVVAEQGAKLGAVMPALRVSLSGRLAGPGVFETAEVLGKERTLARIGAALNRRKQP